MIVASRADPASWNIAQALITKIGFEREPRQRTETYSKGNVRLLVLEKLGIYADPSEIPADVGTTIFVSKHVSASGRAALTVHTTGNLTKEAKFGGNPEEVSHVNPSIIRHALSALKAGVAEAGLQLEVTMEATHHGPTSLSMPVCFVEIGSGEKEWTDPILGEIAARAVIFAIANAEETHPTAVGFGGTHYSAKHTRICMEGDYAVGHLVSSHSFDGGVSERVIADTFNKTTGSCNTAIVDWKGLHSNDRRKLTASLEAVGREIVRC
ncbi:MAG TPA: D-aminoacyl-tRNA deacylase [Candidatus Angelobacter sp.]|nr:D-aminoacyl-tRNA deacylase [Candidatus Angelobacter sp.]